MILFIFYRRSCWFMLPLALAVSFSRVYNGVHYPGDVLVGAIVGAGYAVRGDCFANRLAMDRQKMVPALASRIAVLAESKTGNSKLDVSQPGPGFRTADSEF